MKDSLSLVDKVADAILNEIKAILRESVHDAEATCQTDSQFKAPSGNFGIGQSLQVVVSVTFINGTSSTAMTSAVIEPPYAIIR